MKRRTFLLAATGGILLADLPTGTAAGQSIITGFQKLPNNRKLGAPGTFSSLAPTRVPDIVSAPLDVAALTADVFQYAGGRYFRYKELLVFTSGTISLKFQVSNFASGGGINLSFGYPSYALRVRSVLPNGTLGPSNLRAQYTRFGTERVGTLLGAFGNEPDGPCMLEIIGVDSAGNGTSLISHGAYIDRSGGAMNHPMTLLQNCSRDWESLATMNPPWPIVYQYAIAPKAMVSTTRVTPLSPRLGAPFNTAVRAAGITRIEYSISGDGVGTAAAITKSGIVTTEARQNYAFSDVMAKAPRLPLLDGDRGTCTTPYTTDLQWGRNGKLYGANPWQAWVMDAAGHKRTLYGIRHRYPPVWSEASLDGPEVEVVGDWDASIPATERHAWESWGAAWDMRSLLPIDDAAPIPPGETEHPHIGAGPVQFRTDRHGYVLRVQFDGHSHATPAKIQRWVQCDDPWGIFYLNGKIYVSERGKNRISIWSADNPNQYLGYLIADPTAASLGAINQQTRRWAGAPKATCRQHPIVAPEGLRYLDGYVYWGSFAQGEVRRIPLAGGPVEVVCRPITGDNSNYVYLDFSDGSFGPRGTIFLTTWENANNGRPQAFLPIAGQDRDGTLCTHTCFVTAANPKNPPVNSALWTWQGFATNVLQGPGGQWISDSYASAVAVGRVSTSSRPDDPTFGALACSSAAGNVSVYVQTDPAVDGAPPDYAKAIRGGNYYRAKHQLVHGPWCAGPDLPLPWGEDPDCDYFMAEICGYPRV